MKTISILSLVASTLFLLGLESQKIPKKGEIPRTYVRAVYAMPSTYDPIQMNEGTSLMFSELVYEGLLRFDRFFGVEGALAESWETSPDGKTLTFTLRKSAHFHNGQPVTGQDVVYSLSRLVSKKSLVYKYYDAIQGAVEYREGKASSVKGLQAPNRYTVTITLKNPFPPFVYILAGTTAKVFPKGTFEKRNFSQSPFGAGPFQFVSTGKNKVRLKRFEDYHGKKAKVEKMILKNLNQEDAIKEALAGKIHDLSVWPFNGQEEIIKKGKLITSPIIDTWIIGLNSRKAPFDKLEVRKAFKASINQEKFRKKFYPNANPAFGYIPKGLPGHIEKIRIPSNKIQVPSHSPISLHIPAELERSDEMAKFFENELASKGWRVKVNITSWAIMMKKYNEKSMQSFLLAMNMDYPDSEFLLRNFESNNADNFSGIKDAEIDRLLKFARRTQDKIERHRIYQQIAFKVNSLALTVNLLHSTANYWVHPCVEGFNPNPVSVVYIDYRDVSFNKKCLTKEIF